MKKELQDAFKKLAGRKVETFSATVTEVDKTVGTIKVNDGELEYTNVRLASIEKADGNKLYVFPKVGSSVLVSPINEDIHKLYVEAYSDVEELNLTIENTSLKVTSDGFELNGTSFGGMVKAPELKTQLDKLTKRVDDIIAAINNGIPAPGAADGGAGLHTSIKTALAAIQDKENFGEIENETVKHGEN